MRTGTVSICALGFFLTAISAVAQPIDASRGADARVDYAALVRFGPWDDRNYQLTAEDLAYLAPDEAGLSDPVPAFFRIAVRKAIPELRGPGVRYPRSLLNVFMMRYGGYLVGGELYRRVQRVAGQFEVLLEDGVAERDFLAAKALSGEVRLTSPNGAAESAIKINPVNADLVIAGSNGPGFGQVMHFSIDGGESWAPAAALPLGNTCCDPTVDWSSDGSLAYAAALAECGNVCDVVFYRSSDGGATWNDLPGTPRRRLTSDGQNDKEFLHVDQHPSSPHVDNLYLTWHKSNVMQFARSTDFGESWQIQAFSSAADQRGIGSDVTTDVAGGVYYLWPAFNSQRILLRKSSDGGATFGSVVEVATTEGSFAFPVPAMESREAFIYVAADSDRTSGPFAGSVYAAWTDSTASTGFNPVANHARIRVAYSRDGGATWTVTTPHETADALTVDRFHPWLAVADDGTVHVVFYDTRRDPGRSSVDFFHSSSSDGGVSWSAPERLTAVASPNVADSFELGDYNGLDVVLGQLLAVFTDNRAEGGGGGDSVDVYAAGRTVGAAGEIFSDGFESGDLNAWSQPSP